MKFVYIAGPYNGPDYHTIERNIAMAREAAAWCANNGLGFFAPHLNAAHFEVIAPQSNDWYIEMDQRFLPACDYMLLLPGWERSAGTDREKTLAIQLGIRWFFWDDEVMMRELHAIANDLPFTRASIGTESSPLT